MPRKGDRIPEFWSEDALARRDAFEKTRVGNQNAFSIRDAVPSAQKAISTSRRKADCGLCRFDAFRDLNATLQRTNSAIDDFVEIREVLSAGHLDIEHGRSTLSLTTHRTGSSIAGISGPHRRKRPGGFGKYPQLSR
jgi:hypothetical protein